MPRLQLCQASLTLPGPAVPFSLAGLLPGPLFAPPRTILVNVGLDVADGDRVALSGPQSATLLRLLAGQLTPTAGSCAVCGSITALIDLPSALAPEATGRQNLQRLAPGRDLEAAELTGLGELLDVPVFACSPGMRWRLSFAAAAWPADVLLVDECLTGADLAFQPVALARLLWLLERAAAAVVAEPALFAHCSRAVELADAQLREVPRQHRAA